MILYHLNKTRVLRSCVIGVALLKTSPVLSLCDERKEKDSTSRFLGFMSNLAKKQNTREKDLDQSKESTDIAIPDNDSSSLMNGIMRLCNEHKIKLQDMDYENYVQDILRTHQSNYKSFSESLKSSDFLDIIPASVIDDRTKCSLRDVSNVCDNIISQFQKRSSVFQYSFLINLGILRLYSMHRHQKSRHKTYPVDDDVFIAKASHFLRYADDVYGAGSLYLSRNDIIKNNLQNNTAVKNEVSHPRYIVFLDHLTQSLVVVIRGTASVSDIITDLHCNTRPFLNESLQAHTGMATASESLLPSVQEAINIGRSMKNGRYKDYKVVLTGHSLGAGTACLLSMLLASNNPNDSYVTYAFASPPIVSDPQCSVSQTFQAPKLPKNLELHNFVNNEDLIPRCSMHEFVNMLVALDAVDSLLPWSATERTRLLLRGSLTDQEFENIRDVLNHAKGSNELEPSEDFRLVTPGHVYWLQPAMPSDANENTSYSLVRMQSCEDIFTGTLFTGDTMFRDHLATNYKISLTNVHNPSE